MRPRDILSTNLRTLMATRPALSTIRKIVEASNGTLSNGKVGRITAATHTTDIDTLEAIAAVFDVEPWQLLVEGLNPNALPALSNEKILLQIRELVQQSLPSSLENPLSETSDQPVKQKQAASPLPALHRALDVKGIGKNDTAGRLNKPASKPKRGRRSA